MRECLKCFENGMLVLPTTFEECLTYEMQICWLKNYIDSKEFAGDDKKLAELEQKLVDLQHDVELLKPKNYVIPFQNVTDQFLDEDSLGISASVMEFAGAEIVSFTDYKTVDDLRSVINRVVVATTNFSAEPFDLEFQGHINVTVGVTYPGGGGAVSIAAPCEYVLSSDMKTATIHVVGYHSVLLPSSTAISNVTHRLYTIRFRKTFTVNVEQREV